MVMIISGLALHSPQALWWHRTESLATHSPSACDLETAVTATLTPHQGANMAIYGHPVLFYVSGADPPTFWLRLLRETHRKTRIMTDVMQLCVEGAPLSIPHKF